MISTSVVDCMGKGSGDNSNLSMDFQFHCPLALHISQMCLTTSTASPEVEKKGTVEHVIGGAHISMSILVCISYRIISAKCANLPVE